MGLRKYITKYKDYETKELARRASKRKKISTYRSLTTKKTKVDIKDVKFKPTAYTKAIGNPYGTKFPKAKGTLKKIKMSKAKKRKVKKVIYYK